MKNTKLVITLLISFLMIFSNISFSSIVYASENDSKSIVFGPESISNAMIDTSGTAADSHIWFGNKANMSRRGYPSVYYSGEWMDEGTPYWRVLDANSSNDYGDGVSGDLHNMLVMSEYLWRNTGPSNGYRYGADGTTNYQGSNIQSQMTLMYTTGLFSNIEKTAMKGQQKTEPAGSLYKGDWGETILTSSDVVFIPSAFEIEKYISSKANPDTNWSTNDTDVNLTAYRGSKEMTNVGAANDNVNSTAYWWLRSVYKNPSNTAGAGAVYENRVVHYSSYNSLFALRPAFNIDLDKVVLASMAKDGKDCGLVGSNSLKTVKAKTSDDWKFTILDSNEHGNFEISSVSKNQARRTITFVYSGAKIGAGEYLSAIIVNSRGEVTYYGRIIDLSSGNDTGTAMIDISSCETTDTDTLYVFNEKCNGDYLTDYSSAMQSAGNLFDHEVVHTHLLKKTDAVEPTCVLDGNIDYWTCTLCDKVYKDENGNIETDEVGIVDPATGHALIKTDAVPATCTTKGNIEYWTCSTCGLLFSDEEGTQSINKNQTVISATGHSWGKWEYLDETLHKRICENDSEHEETGDHDWATYYMTDIEPTCTEEGSESIHCTICLASKPGTEETIPTIAHTYGDWQVTKEATCTTDGVKEKVCTVCGDKVTETIHSQGHMFADEYTVDIAPTCTTEGSKSKHCTICGEIDGSSVETISALGHSFGDWVDTTPNTCEDSGVHQHSCTVCGYTESEVTDPKGHDVEDHFTIDVPATCTTDGSQSKHCTRCDAVFESEVIPATGHSYSDWVTTKEATCIEKGSKEKTCSKCSDKITAEISAKGHAWNDESTIDKPATCTENGFQSTHCARCKETKDIEVIPALGHAWNKTPTVDKIPTCTADGLESIHCSRCDAIKDGSKNVVAKTGHKFSAWTTTKKATELAAGQQKRKCSACGKTETKTIAQLKPTLPAVKITKPKAAKKSATIKWKKVSKTNQKKIAKIQIQYSTDKTFKTGVKTVTAKKSAASKKITKMTSKKTYYVRIRAYKSSGGVVHVSKWSTVRSVKVK